MSRLRVDIDAWLGSLPPNLALTDSSASQSVGIDRPSKRRRLDMPSPPPTVRETTDRGSQDTDTLTSRLPQSTKRKNTDGDAGVVGVGGESGLHSTMVFGLEEPLDSDTPRAPRQRQQHHVYRTGSPPKRLRGSTTDLFSASSVSGSSSIWSADSGRSRKSTSPRKQATALAMFSNIPIQRNELAELIEQEGLPSDLEECLGLILGVQDGKGVLSNGNRQQLRDVLTGGALSKRWLEDDYHFDDTRKKYGKTPSPEHVQSLARTAADCWKRDCEEAVWNLEVHQSLLAMALRLGEKHDLDHLVRFTGCTTAAIQHEYSDRDSTYTTNSKVDFCIFIDPANDPTPNIQTATKALQRSLPGASINHSSSFALKDLPLALFIETKRSSTDRLGAVNQLGVWQRSHFIFLRRIRDHARSLAAAAGQTLPLGLDQLPRWLPGLVVLGHSWHFVPATIDDEFRVMTTWFGTEAFGGTTSVLETYKVVLVLQGLRAWVEKTFWPTLRKLIIFIEQFESQAAELSGAG